MGDITYKGQVIDLDKVYTISEVKKIFGEDLTGLRFLEGQYPSTCKGIVTAMFECDCSGTPYTIQVKADCTYDSSGECTVCGGTL